jgi:chromosome segregation ATPase
MTLNFDNNCPIINDSIAEFKFDIKILLNEMIYECLSTPIEKKDFNIYYTKKIYEIFESRFEGVIASNQKMRAVVERQLDELETDLKVVKTAKKELDEKVDELETEKTKLENQIDKLKDELKEINNTCLQDWYSNLGKTLDRVRDERQKLTDQIIKLENQITELEKGKTELENQIDELEDEITEYKNMFYYQKK